MGWGSGSYLMMDVIRCLKGRILDEALRTTLYRDLIATFRAHDCDTLGDCMQIDPAFDVAFEEAFPITDGTDA